MSSSLAGLCLSLVLSLCLSLSLTAAPATAEPLQLAAQGRLTSSGGPVSDGGYAMAVGLYDVQTGGKPLFYESFLAVPVNGGVFALTLGAAQIPLDSATAASSKPLFVGVTVAGEPELPRQPLLRVPSAVHALVAAQAADVGCTGCVGADDLAKAAVTGEKIANGAVGSNHVNFNWAAAESPGGSANFALGANTAKLADSAKNADNAAFADEAGSAKGLLCTGCITAKHLHDKVAEDLVAGGKLAKVATSGKYSDLQGGPDLTGYGSLGGDNTWKGGQSFGGALKFNMQQAQLFRFQNADKDPATCDANAIGVAYYNTAVQALVVCNGKAWKPFAQVSGIGSDAANPGASCKAILDSGDQSQDGVYWIKPSPGNAAFQVWCDLSGGGWMLLMKTSSKSAWGYTDAVWTKTDDTGGAVPAPTEDADKVSRAFYFSTITATRACIAKFDGGGYACETLNHSGSTARNLANGSALGSAEGTKNLLTATWKSITAGGVWGAYTWHRFGWNTGTSSHGGCRLGFTADNDSSDSQDAGLGFGLHQAASPSISAGAGYYHYPWNPAPNPPTAVLQGQIWGR